MKLFIILLALIACSFGCVNKSNHDSQQIHEKIKLKIYLEDLGYWVLEPSISRQKYKVTDTSYLIIDLKDYRGALKFKMYNLKDHLIEQGQYKNALAVFKRYVTVYSGPSGSVRTIVEDYYEPLPIGNWAFFLNGRLIKMENRGD